MPRTLLVMIGLLGTGGVAVAGGLYQRICDNGLVILTQEDHAAPVAHVRVYVLTGSMNEGQHLGQGISHVLEHLVAGGSTTTRTEKETQAILESMGNQMNAYTTKDHTAYFITAPSDRIETAVDLLADWLLHAAIRKNEFKREMGVVTREIEKGLSEPERVHNNALFQAVFRVHPVRHPTIGYLDAFKRLTRQDVINYYRTHYVPNNMVAVAVGDFDPVAVADRIEKAFADAPRRELPQEVFPMEPRQMGRRQRKTGMDISAAYVSIAYRTVPLDHPDLYPLDVLSYILSNGESSRLVRRLRDELGLVTSVSSYSYTPPWDGGLFSIDLELRPENVHAATEAVQAELNRIVDTLVDPAELETAKRKKQSDLVFGSQTVEARAASIGSGYLSTGNPDFDTLYVRRIQDVTAQQVQDAARRYFTPENQTVVLTLPRALAAQEPQTSTAAAAALRPSLHRLPNGLRVLHLHNPSLPMVHVTAVMKAGVSYETDAQAGITNLTGRMLPRGAGPWSAQEIARFFDSIGGTCAPTSGYNSLGLSMNILAQDFEAALPYFTAQVTQPTFPDDELEIIRRQVLAELDRLDDDWTTEAMRLFRSAFFAGSPYRNVPLGRPESVRSLTREQLVGYHRAVARPDNTVLAVFGDLPWERVLPAVVTAFSAWQGDETGQPLVLPSVQAATGTQRVQKKTEKQLAAIYMGYPGLRVHDTRDRDVMTVIDAALSGIYYPGGRLHSELRGRQLVYVVHAFQAPGLLPGFFGIYAGTQPDKAEEVVDRIQRQVQRLIDEPLPERELRQAIDMAVAADALSNQTNAELAQRAAFNELFGLGYRYDDNYADRIRSVTSQEVQAVAARYLREPTIAVTSPAAEQPHP